MSEENKDVDLYAELDKTLKEAEESGEEEAPVASDQKPTDDIPSESKEGDETELSEEEIAKLSPRAQKRIRDLAEQVKTFAEKPKEEIPEEKENSPQDDVTPSFKNVQEFLAAVQDEPSRKLLENFYNVVKGEISQTLSPIEQANAKTKFETEFSQYSKIEGIEAYKNDLQKTFLRNPNQSLKELVGAVVVDLQLKKVKPIDGKPSEVNRNGKVDTSTLSLEELYNVLEQGKE